MPFLNCTFFQILAHFVSAKPTLEVPLDDSSGSIINSNANNPDISTHPSGSERYDIQIEKIFTIFFRSD